MMMVRKSKGLSDRHIRILELLQKYQDKGYPPSIREIGEQTGVTSTSVVNYYLEQLEKWGYIERDRRISRGLRVTDKVAEIAGMFSAGIQAAAHTAVEAASELLRIPIAGQIAAGLPIDVPNTGLAYETNEEIAAVEVARSLLPKKTDGLFALKVKGESMIDAMVNDGDIVIMKPAIEARNGEMVAVWLNDRDETTLKYFYYEKGHVRLQPANPSMEPIIIDNPKTVEIKGKVVMVVRQFQATM
jgi:repressor LexA